MVIVVMGVSGAGKTTVGRRLASELGWSFHDADDLHAPGNVEHMRSGLPLTDELRSPWLATLAKLIGDHARDGRPMVLACSALKRSYRAALLADAPDTADVRMVYLRAEAEVLKHRLAGRAGHFFPPDLLTSQLATLEAPDEEAPVLVLDANLPVDDLVAGIRDEFNI